MGKYKILCFNADKPHEVSQKEVDGQAVHFSGYEDFHFFSHHHMDGDKWGSWEVHVISETTSGVMIAKDLSPEGVLATASKLLANDTPEGLQVKIDQFLTMRKELENGR